MKTVRMLMYFLTLLLMSPMLWAQSVNVNSADADELAAAIKGVGQKTARAIVVYREQHGPFRTVEELAKVKGIGPSTIDKNRPNLSVGGHNELQARQE